MIATNWDWDRNSATSTTPRGEDVVWYRIEEAEPEQTPDIFSDDAMQSREKHLYFLSTIGARIAYKRWKQTKFFFLTLLYWMSHYINTPYNQPCVAFNSQYFSGVMPKNRGRHFDRKFNPQSITKER